MESDGDGDNSNREVQLVADTMRCVNQYLTDGNDTLALAQVNEDWGRALKENVDDIWQLEWEMFREDNKNEKWFTEKVYTVPFKESRFSSTFNKLRKIAKKDEKQFQSLRQKLTETVEVVENPTPIELLIANGQAKMQAMSQEEWDNVMKQRPKVRMMLAKSGCIVAAPVLAVLGLALVPLSIVTSAAYLTWAKVTGNNHGGGGPVGAGSAFAVLILGAAPTAFPWMGAGMALNVVVSEKNLRKIPDLYKSFGDYNKRRADLESQKPKSENDLSLRYTY